LGRGRDEAGSGADGGSSALPPPTSDPSPRPGLALRLAGALWRFWYTYGFLSEGRRWVEAALAVGAQEPAAERAAALVGGGALAQAQGDRARARALLEEGVSAFRAAGLAAGVATALNFLGLVARDEGDDAQAVALHEEALALAPRGR
jgi:tetratricopeptide (TPR) repeat protein